MPLTKRYLSCLLGSLALLVTSEVAAQDTARAQALYNEGAIALESGDLVGACERFEGARSLLETAVIQDAVARCHERLGKIATAAGELDQLAVLLTQRGKLPEAAAARDRAEGLKKRMSFLTLTVAEIDRATVEIVEDGHPLPRAVLGLALPIDPGEHWIEIVAPGKLAVRKMVRLAEGERATLELPPLEDTVNKTDEMDKSSDELIEPSVASVAVGARTARPPSTYRAPLYVATGLAAVGVVTTAIAAPYAYLQQQDARARCPSATNLCLDREGLAANDRARKAYPIAMVAGTVGVTAGLLVGYLGWQMLGERRANAAGWTMGPTMGAGGTGMTIGGNL